MKILLPFLILYQRYSILICLTFFLSISIFLANIGLRVLSIWFLTISILVKLPELIDLNYVILFIIGIISIIFRVIGRYFERLISHDITLRLLSNLRIFIFNKIIPLSPSGVIKFNQANLLNNFISDINIMDNLYPRVLLPLISIVVIIFIMIYVLSSINLLFTLILGSILLFLLFLISIIIYQYGKFIGKKLSFFREKYRSNLVIWLQSQAELQIFNGINKLRDNLNIIEKHWQYYQWKEYLLNSIVQAVMIFITGVTIILLFWLITNNIENSIQFYKLIIFFIFSTLSLFEGVTPVISAFHYFGQIISSVTRIRNIIDCKPLVIFPMICTHVITNKIIISLQNIKFTYPNQLIPVLVDITLEIISGEHIVLLGRTGCGKSTLLQLLTRAWDVDSGRILLNGFSLKTYNEIKLRKIISFVTQRIYIFNKTLRDNLIFAKSSATDKELIKVLELVGLVKLLKKRGLNTWLGDGGCSLSFGEQRRLGIARALLYSAPLFLVDEPTEGLDPKTEQDILTLLRHHCKEKTLILVTHHLTGLERFDRVCIMENGKIIKQGSPNIIINKNKNYPYIY
ncbi:ATP-binding/permease protein CydC [Serratia symbiotica]|nr:ATP-binding/permease protein CydC [Serratia symbiotica]